MSINRAVSLTTLTLLLAALSVLPALRAADIPGDSKGVSDLLSQAKTQAIQLKNDAADMESFTLSTLSWQSHAAKITEIKEHVNAVGKTVSKLNQAKDTASPWQKTAIERVNPVMGELAMNVEATINHLNKEQGRLLNTQEHKDYLKSSAELATRMASVVSDFVDYGQTKAKFEELSHKLEIAER
jgi:hypothetical protein